MWFQHTLRRIRLAFSSLFFGEYVRRVFLPGIINFRSFQHEHTGGDARFSTFLEAAIPIGIVKGCLHPM
jgi:hypothetical protein